MTALPGLWNLTPLAAVLGLLALQFWLISTGRLITRNQHLDIVKTHERLSEIQQEAIAEWRTTAHGLESRAIVLPNKEIAERVLHGGD